MCVGFLPLSCAVPVSGYSCLPFSDIGQEIGARARAEGGRRGSRVVSDFDLEHLEHLECKSLTAHPGPILVTFLFSPLGSDPKRQPTDAGEGDAV